MKGYKIMIDPDELDYKFIAKEIARAMGRVRLSKEHSDYLEHAAEQVLIAKLKYRAENLQLILDRVENERG